MNSHELARQLLALPDSEVWLQVEYDEGPAEFLFRFKVEHRQPEWRYTTPEDKSRPKAVILVEEGMEF